jgi:hypothetical protein
MSINSDNVENIAIYLTCFTLRDYDLTNMPVGKFHAAFEVVWAVTTAFPEILARQLCPYTKKKV